MTSSGQYDESVDVGNVDRYQVTNQGDGITYYLALKAYNMNGVESRDFSDEVKATFRSPQVSGISLSSGSTRGGEEVTITGKNFAKGSIVLFGGTHLKVKSITLDTIVVSTPDRKAGPADVVILRPDGTRASLSQGRFTFY